MVSWTIRTARSLNSAGCWCPDPCLGVGCFGADIDYILPKNAASIKPRAVHGHYLNSEIELGRGVLDLIRTHGDRVGSPRFASRHQSQRHRLALQAEPEMVASAWP